jgi:hypothetical protein
MVDMVDHITEVIRAPSRSRLAIGHITFAARVTTQATRTTLGEQVIGGGGMVIELGYTAITLSGDTDGTVFRGNRYSNNWLSQAPACQTEAQPGCEAT